MCVKHPYEDTQIHQGRRDDVRGHKIQEGTRNPEDVVE